MVFLQVQTRKEEEPLHLPPQAGGVPTFYFPHGRPQDTVNVDAVIRAKIERTFAQFPHERATMEDMGRVAKVECPRGPWGSSFGRGQAQSSASASALRGPWSLRPRGLVLSSGLAIGGTQTACVPFPGSLVTFEGPSPRSSALRPSRVSPAQGARCPQPTRCVCDSRLTLSVTEAPITGECGSWTLRVDAQSFWRLLWLLQERDTVPSAVLVAGWLL